MIYHADCIHLPYLLAESGHTAGIDLIMTSTPYPGMRAFELTFAEYLGWWGERLTPLLDLMNDTAVLVQVINLPRREDGRFDTRLFSLPRQLEADLSLYPIDVYVWGKPNPPPSAASRYGRYDSSGYELVMVFGKTADYSFYPQRRPYKAKSVAGDGRAKRRHVVDVAGRNAHGHHDLHEEGARQTNLLLLSSTGGRKRPRVHGGSFPELLAERFILQHTQPGQVVVDPCCGAGTVPVVAKRYGRIGIGCDADSYAVEIARAWAAGSPVGLL